MLNIPSIETRYAGCRFRSRLEARHAVFFDHLGIFWEYEPEGFILPSGYYLPDFHIPVQPRTANTEFWIEIKPNQEAADSDRRICEFEGATLVLTRINERDVLITPDDPDGLKCREWIMLIGQFPRSDSLWNCCPPDSEYHGEISYDTPYLWCVCPCGATIGFQFEGRGMRIPCQCTEDRDGDRYHSQDHPQLMAAYEAARSARFEFGECRKGSNG